MNSMIRKITLPFVFIYSLNVNAGGIPTIDVAAIAQSLIDYEQQLEQVLKGQLTIERLDAQFLQQITEYEQMLREYQHMLKQMQKLPEQIKAYPDKVEFTINPETGEVQFGVLTEEGYNDIDKKVRRIYGDVRSVTTLDKAFMESNISEDDLSALKAEVGNYNHHIKTNVKKERYLKSFAKQNSDRQKLMVKDINPEFNKVMNESENQLKTLHLIATQNQALLKAINDLTLIMTAQLENTGRLSDAYYGDIAASYERDINDLLK